MNKTKAVSLLLSLALLLSIVIPGTLALQAVATGTQDDSGMVIDKTARKNEDDSYTITLEAYATGSKITTETKTDVPTDIVLVLDQSGSMDDPMNTYAFRAYTNKDNGDYYNLSHNGAGQPNLYHQLADGSYASVSVTMTRGEGSYTYIQCGSNWKNDVLGSGDDYKKYEGNLYAKGSDGSYQKVTLKTVDDPKSILDNFIYVFPDDEEVNGGHFNDSPNFGDKGPLYYRTEVPGEGTYTYTYTDQDGVKQTIGTSTGEATQPEFPLYERYSSGRVTRLEALKNAVSGFADSVKTKAAGQDGKIGTADDVNHRVAVVGFATGNYTNDSSDYPTYENTEVFVGSTQYNYNNNVSSHYKEALQDMNTQAGQANVNASTNALAALGATYPNYGLEMAKGILDANPVQQGEKRNRVVILFTDGSPGWSRYDTNVANAAVTEAKNLKDAGVTVYSVGIFEGADATSAGIAVGANNRQANQFMQNVSSNNGTPRNPSYYLSASDADTLNNIFQQISDQIESGGSSTTLDENAVIKDIISPQFQLPAGTDADDITVQTVPCTGIANNIPSWGEPVPFKANVTVNADTGNVAVSGFDFAANYVGMDNLNDVETLHKPAQKLVISFTVEPKPDFLGGNGVYTNTSAGVYENGDATEPMFEFERPDVDVEIKDITVTAEDKNVYLLGALTADEIKSGATVKVGNVELKLGEENYGLESWQYEYVNIKVSYQDKDGNTVTDLSDLKEDTTYSVSVTVTPKTKGDATAQTGNGEGKINVFKPELTFRDSQVYYGDTVPADFTANKVSEIWKHGDKTSTDADVVMTGDAPTLDMTYTPDDTKIQEGKVNTKQDVPVDVGVKIGQTDVSMHTVFQHTCCEGKTCVLPENQEFLLHINTCQLTVTKTGGAAGEPYVFTVMKDGSKYSEVTIVGNSSETIYELPVGTYTIEEDTGWSWRYKASINGSAMLSSSAPSGSITCTNSKTENYWLNGFSQVVKNIFDGQN